MKKRYLLTALLSLGLAAGVSWAAKGGKGGGGQGGGGNPSTLNVIADFDSEGHLLETPSNMTYSANNVDSGHVNMPGTGNFTMELRDTSRSLWFDFTDVITSGPADDAFFHGDALAMQLFMSINRECLVPDFDATDPLAPTCLNPDGSDALPNTAGSLKAMRVEGADLLLRLSGRFDNPDLNKSTYLLRCGAFDHPGTDLVQATCVTESPVSPGDDPSCSKWQLDPFPVNGGDGELVCRVQRQVTSKGSTTTTDVADYNLSFGLTLYRDVNGDGVPD